MQKQTVLYAVTCARPAKGVTVEEAQQSLYVTRYDTKDSQTLALPCVRAKTQVEPESLVAELTARFSLALYAPFIIVPMPDLSSATRHVYVLLSLAKYQMPVETFKKNFRTGVKPPVVVMAQDVSLSNDEQYIKQWDKDSATLLHNLTFYISEIEHPQSKAQASDLARKSFQRMFSGEKPAASVKPVEAEEPVLDDAEVKPALETEYSKELEESLIAEDREAQDAITEGHRLMLEEDAAADAVQFNGTHTGRVSGSEQATSNVPQAA